jgi:hypothetical protein
LLPFLLAAARWVCAAWSERAIEEAKRKKLGAQWMIVCEDGVTQAGSLDALGCSPGVLKPWKKLED